VQLFDTPELHPFDTRASPLGLTCHKAFDGHIGRPRRMHGSIGAIPARRAMSAHVAIAVLKCALRDSQVLSRRRHPSLAMACHMHGRALTRRPPGHQRTRPPPCVGACAWAAGFKVSYSSSWIHAVWNPPAGPGSQCAWVLHAHVIRMVAWHSTNCTIIRKQLHLTWIPKVHLSLFACVIPPSYPPLLQPGPAASTCTCQCHIGSCATGALHVPLYPSIKSMSCTYLLALSRARGRSAQVTAHASTCAFHQESGDPHKLHFCSSQNAAPSGVLLLCHVQLILCVHAPMYRQ